MRLLLAATMLVLVTGIGSALLQQKPDILQAYNQERQLSDRGSVPFIPVVLSAFIASLASSLVQLSMQSFNGKIKKDFSVICEI